jgi:hypothetical protein
VVPARHQGALEEAVSQADGLSLSPKKIVILSEAKNLRISLLLLLVLLDTSNKVVIPE